MTTLGVVVVVLAFVFGILLLTGHGDFLLQAGIAPGTKKVYDDKKVSKASGIAFLLVGVISVIDLFTEALAFKIAYLAAICVIFGVMLWYIVNKCKL